MPRNKSKHTYTLFTWQDGAYLAYGEFEGTYAQVYAHHKPSIQQMAARGQQFKILPFSALGGIAPL